MAAASAQAWPGLAPEQQKLLLAALASNKKRRSESNANASTNNTANSNDTVSASSVNPSVFSKANSDPFAMTSTASSTFDLGAGDSAFDVDFSKGFDDFSEPFPNFANGEAEGEQGEKRKVSEDDDDDFDEQGDEKRRDSEPKEAKKPGRKLLTSEPTTKRKAQNRAAQRAFRERKEKHLKDLETKVADLEKASESANHENSVLRAQVERLQEELKDYRRRLSLTGPSLNGSPPSARPSLDGDQSFGSSSLDFNFNFDFPKFGGMPGSMLPSTQAVGKTPSQQESSPHSSYDNTNANALNSHHNSVSSVSNEKSQTQNNNQNAYGAPMFGTGFFDIMGGNATQSPHPMSNSLNGSLTDTNGRSPAQSNSSASRSPASNNDNGPSSSCCTSPDPVDWANIYNSANKSQKNSADRNTMSTNNTTPGLTNAKTPNSENFSLDFLANQNGGSFDPVLFGDYRDTQSAIIGDDTFTGGFFEDGLSLPNFDDPFNFNMSAETTNPAPAPSNGAFKQMQQPQAVQKKKPNLLEQVAKQRDGEYEDESDKHLVMPSSTDDYTKVAPNLMTCHKIWNQLQNCPKFKSGDFDVDTLCSELSAKAKCTETGVAVPKEAVEAALWKLAGGPLNEQEQSASPASKSTTGEAEKKLDPRVEAARRFEKFMASH